MTSPQYYARGLRAALLGAVVNATLAVVKILTGLIGNSYALIADGIESCVDVFSSLAVYGGLRVARTPPDPEHPFGHDKAESLIGVGVALALIVAALAMGVQSVRAIIEPGDGPSWFTLPVLVGVVVLKWALSKRVLRVGVGLGSSALKADAWHHRSDALTSMAAFIGISVALIGGDGWEAADGWAALAACGVILFNGVLLLRPALHEIMDGSVDPDLQRGIMRTAGDVEGVRDIEKCRVRKSGLRLLMDIHVQVDGELTVNDGHEIGHRVKDRLMESDPRIRDVVVHIEPHGAEARIVNGE